MSTFKTFDFFAKIYDNNRDNSRFPRGQENTSFFYMPKILIFSLAYHPFVGGAEVAIKEITDRLPDFQFEMITADLDGRQKSEEQIGNIKVHRLSFAQSARANEVVASSPSLMPVRLGRKGGGRGRFKNILTKYLFPWLAYRRAIKLHRENHYDMIWAMMANQAGWAALKFKKKFPEVKYLLTLQEGDSEWDIWWRTFLIRPIYKNIYRRADHIQAISSFLAKRAKKLGARCAVEVVGNGIADVVARESAQGGRPRQSQVNQDGNVKKIITVSRLVKKNGIKNLIESFQILVTRYSLPVTLKIVGDGPLRPDLEKLARDFKIDKQTEFVGNIHNQKVYEFLSQADVFVRPSLSEGLGNAFLEAMAVGVPVIATPVGGIPDFLKDGETGWFCKVKDPASIAEKIAYILDEKNKDEVARVVENARKMVEEKYNWNNIAISMGRIFNQLTSKS